MAIHNISNSVKLSAVTLAAASILVCYSYWQAKEIDELNHSLAQQLAAIKILQGIQNQESCTTKTDPHSFKPIPIATKKPESLVTNSVISNDFSHQPISGFAAETQPNPQEPLLTSEDIRTFFTTLQGETWTDTYSDEELLNDGPQLLAAHIEDSQQDFDTSIIAAYAINELTGDPIPEPLSQTLLHKAEMANDPEDLEEVLFLIAEQGYSKSSQLASELINSHNQDARMVGIYLLATDQDSEAAAPALANQIYTYPEETIQVLGQLLDD